jgi:ATP synthase subunit 6
MTLSLALSINLSIIFLGFENQGVNFLNLFVPRGGPKFLFPLITLIEVISYLLRTFSLSIRLFANMMAGHILLYILASFGVSLSTFFYGIFMVFPFTMIFPIIILEFGIAFLQAYVFIVLIAIYLNEAVHSTH